MCELGWQPFFESKGQAHVRLAAAFEKVFKVHVAATAVEKNIPPTPRRNKAQQFLQWTALYQVHGFSIAEIAREWQLGNRSLDALTGRRHVSQTVRRYQLFLGLPA